MWTPEIVRARFVEAAATERFLPAVGIGGGNGYWPQFVHDKEDMDGWDDQARLDNAERWKGRAPLGAISRHAECMSWTTEHIKLEDRRRLVWAFAFCRANKWEFSGLCNRKGWVKSTAYDQLNKTWSRLSALFCNSGLFLRPPSEFWLGHEAPEMPEILVTSRERGAKFQKVPTAVIYERSKDLIRTQDDAENFAKFLQKHNSSARREQARREAKLRQQIEAA
jgi:hypothetical protein